MKNVLVLSKGDTKQCSNCGSPFEMKADNHKYCGQPCRSVVHNMRRKPRVGEAETHKRTRARFIREGRCTKCGKPNPEKEFYKTCPNCRDAVNLARS